LFPWAEGGIVSFRAYAQGRELSGAGGRAQRGRGGLGAERGIVCNCSSDAARYSGRVEAASARGKTYDN